MAKAQSTTYQIEQSGIEPGCFNLYLNTLDVETASFILAALLARDPTACSVGRMVPHTEALETAAHERALRLATLRPGHNSVCCCAPVARSFPTTQELQDRIPVPPHPDRQRPGGMTVGDHIAARTRAVTELHGARGLDPGLQAWAADQVLRETPASATHALRDNTSADLRWFHHSVVEGVDTSSHRGLRFELRDAADDCGVQLSIHVEHGPPMPLCWVNQFNCNTAGACWFGNDAEAKRAAMKVAADRNLQVDGDGHVTGH